MRGFSTYFHLFRIGTESKLKPKLRINPYILFLPNNELDQYEAENHPWTFFYFPVSRNF